MIALISKKLIICASLRFICSTIVVKKLSKFNLKYIRIYKHTHTRTQCWDTVRTARNLICDASYACRVKMPTPYKTIMLKVFILSTKANNSFQILSMVQH